MKKVLTIAAVLLAWAAVAWGAAATKAVSIKGMKYNPASISIKAGDTVAWKNDDDRDHTVVADDGSFKSEKIGSGESFSHTFSKAGKYAYSCSYHPRMKGTVVVE